MTQTQKIIAWAVVGFVVGFGTGVVVQRTRSPAATPQAENQNASGTVSIMLDFGDGTLKTLDNITIGDNDNLFDVLKRSTQAAGLAFDSKDYKDLGSLVTQLGDKKNGAGNRYWQYWVNNQSPRVGAGAYILHPGDVVEWKFTPSQF
jgi:hypothetical protein